MKPEMNNKSIAVTFQDHEFKICQDMSPFYSCFERCGIIARNIFCSCHFTCLYYGNCCLDFFFRCHLHFINSNNSDGKCQNGELRCNMNDFNDTLYNSHQSIDYVFGNMSQLARIQQNPGKVCLSIGSWMSFWVKTTCEGTSFEKLAAQCEESQFDILDSDTWPVLTISGEMRVYKNDACAICNGENSSNLCFMDVQLDCPDNYVYLLLQTNTTE